MKKMLFNFKDSMLTREDLKNIKGGYDPNPYDSEPEEEGGGNSACQTTNCTKTTYNFSTGQYVTTTKKCNSSTYTTVVNGKTYTHCLYVCPIEGASGCY